MAATFDAAIAAAGKDKAPGFQLADADVHPKFGEKAVASPVKIAANDDKGIDFDKHKMEAIDGKKWLHDPTELAKLMSDGFRNTGKLELMDGYMMNEAMRANYKDLQGWAGKFNEALKGTGTSINMGDKTPTVGQGGVMNIYTAHIMHGGKETDSTRVSF